MWPEPPIVCGPVFIDCSSPPAAWQRWLSHEPNGGKESIPATRQCLSWVNRDRTAQPFLPSDVRIAPKATAGGEVRQVKLGRSAIFLVLTAHHNFERIIRQRPLRRLRLVPRCAHPDVTLFMCSQDHRHRLRMDRFHHRIGLRGQEAIDEKRLRDTLN